MTIKSIIASSLLLLLNACNQSGLSRDAKNVYDNKDEIIREFTNISVWRRGDSAFSLHIFNDGKVNRYSFRGDNGLKLQGDTVQFQLNKIERFKNVDTLGQKNVVRELLAELLNKMNSINVRDVNSDFMHAGINLKIYLWQGGAVFFVRDLSTVTNPQWKNYIKESKMIDENWYYNKKE